MKILIGATRLICLLIVFGLSANSLSAHDWYVDNVGGSDENEGTRSTRPFLTIAKALKKAEQGDRIILADSGQPYRESVTLSGSRKSGSDLKPFYLIGNGATLDGRKSVEADQWEHFAGDVFRFQPKLKSFQVLYRDDRPILPVQVKDRSSIATALSAGQWTSFQGWIYFRVEPRMDPAKYSLSYCSKAAGITLYRVSHVVIQDLTIQGFQLDGINCHDLTKNVTLSGITSRGNGRSGVFVGGASRCKLDSSLIGDNGAAQVFAEGYCKLDVENCQLLDSEDHGKPLVIKGGKVSVDGKPVKK